MSAPTPPQSHTSSAARTRHLRRNVPTILHELMVSRSPSDPLPSRPRPTPEQQEFLWTCWEYRGKSQKALASALKIGESDVSKKKRPCIENGWLLDELIPSRSAMGFNLSYRIDVQIAPDVITDNIEAFKGEAGLGQHNPQKALALYILNKLGVPTDDVGMPRLLVEDIYILLGNDADLTIMVSVVDHADVFDWVTEWLRCVPGIVNTNTCLQAWSVRAGQISTLRRHGRPTAPTTPRK